MKAEGYEEEIHQKSTERWIIKRKFRVIYVVAPFMNQHNFLNHSAKNENVMENMMKNILLDFVG